MDVRIVIPIIGILVGGFITFYIRHKNRIQGAKDTFGTFIRQKIIEIPSFKILEFYLKTKPAIGKAVAVLSHFFASKDRIAIEALWKRYDQIPESNLDAESEKAQLQESFRALDKLAGIKS